MKIFTTTTPLFTGFLFFAKYIICLHMITSLVFVCCYFQCSYIASPCKHSTDFSYVETCYFDKPKSENIILSKTPPPPSLAYVKVIGFLAAGIFLIVFIWNCGHMVGLPPLGGAPGPAQPTTTEEGAVIGGQVVIVLYNYITLI